MDDIDWSPDKSNSISSTTGRSVVDGIRTAQVRQEAASKTQVAALLDLLDLHLTNARAGQPVALDRVLLRIPALASEARGAIGTLIEALAIPTQVTVQEKDQIGRWVPATVGWDQENASEYAGWPELLTRPRPVPTLVSGIVEAAGLPALRAYPMLSTASGWSLRLEGLEVARATATTARLTVGKDGKTGARSQMRENWIEATGQADPFVTDDAQAAAALISKFAQAWQALAADSTDHDEHALESRILRGATPIVIDSGPLSVIQPDPVVNWGSQFPTMWGPGGSSRYLDALLRDGSTPWAIEMKVQGGAGVGQYYRHAVAQAVLYREFIRRATPLHPWFEKRGLIATACMAAVVVPRLTHPKHAPWREHVVRVCDAFDVAFVEVDHEHALRH